MMSPDEEAENCDRDTGKRDERVAERFPPGEGADDFTNHAHGRHNHDVNRGMRVEPEKMLKKDRIAAERWIENADVKAAFHGHQQDGHCNYGRSEDLNHGS